MINFKGEERKAPAAVPSERNPPSDSWLLSLLSPAGPAASTLLGVLGQSQADESRREMGCCGVQWAGERGGRQGGSPSEALQIGVDSSSDCVITKVQLSCHLNLSSLLK